VGVESRGGGETFFFLFRVSFREGGKVFGKGGWCWWGGLCVFCCPGGWLFGSIWGAFLWVFLGRGGTGNVPGGRTVFCVPENGFFPFGTLVFPHAVRPSVDLLDCP